MGFASKLEDETERRGGEVPRPILHRLAYVFDAYGATADSSEIQRPVLWFDEDAEQKLSEILERLEQTHQRKLRAFIALEDATGKGLEKSFGKSVGKTLRAHKKTGTRYTRTSRVSCAVCPSDAGRATAQME